jgi:hypothetical protein
MLKRLALRAPILLALVVTVTWALVGSAESKAVTGSGQIIVENQADPDDGTFFPFEVPWLAVLGPDVELPHGGTASSGDLAAGTYTLCEGAFEYDCKAPDGWQLADLDCNDPDGGTTTDLSAATATVDLDDGETITCTFTNHKPTGQIIVQKLADPDDGTFFPFEVDWITQTQADFSLQHGDSHNSGDLAPGTYTLCEGAHEADCKTPDGWQLADLDCNDPDGGTTTDLTAATATVDLDDGETITCTFTNEKLHKEGQLTDAATSCETFVNGGALDGTEALYNVKKGKINSVAPGVFFYYDAVVAPASSFAIDVLQTETHPTFSALFGVQQETQIRLYNGDCTAPSATYSVSGATGQAHVSVSGATPGQTFVVSVKYSGATLIGLTAPSPSTVHYGFATLIDGVTDDQDANGLDLTAKK